MGKQRVVHDSFWDDPYITGLDPSEKLLFLYLLTNTQCNVAGIYEVENRRVAFDTGFEIKTVELILKRFVKDKKILRYKNWIIILNFGKHQAVNPNIMKGAERIIKDLPSEVKALKGFERIPYLTLLNLTLPNLTETIKKPMKEEYQKIDFSKITSSWNEWIEYRKEIKKPITPRTEKMQIKMLCGYNKDQQKKIIEKSMINGWTGLFEPDNKNTPRELPDHIIKLDK